MTAPTPLLPEGVPTPHPGSGPPFDPWQEQTWWRALDTDEMETRLITFLPYRSYRESARCLDNKRLGKQRVEAHTIIQSICGQSGGRGWQHHPAVMMWQGHLDELKLYYQEMVMEWIVRGFANSLPMYRASRYVEPWARVHYSKTQPPWLGMPELHASHRAALLAKNPEWYGQFGWEEPHVIDYFWPITTQPKFCPWDGRRYIGTKLDPAVETTE